MVLRHDRLTRGPDGELVAPVGVNLSDALASASAYSVFGRTLGLTGAAAGARRGSGFAAPDLTYAGMATAGLALSLTFHRFGVRSLWHRRPPDGVKD